MSPNSGSTALYVKKGYIAIHGALPGERRAAVTAHYNDLGEDYHPSPYGRRPLWGTLDEVKKEVEELARSLGLV